MAEGITDYAYLYTLERLIEKRRRAAAHAKAVKEARDYLRCAEGAMPELPDVKGLAKADDGALVGLGVEDEARLQAAKWGLARLAGLIEVLGEVSRAPPASRFGSDFRTGEPGA